MLSTNSLLASSCGKLSQAILSHSTLEMESVLGQSPSSVLERNTLGQTPLHLAIGWPDGVARLLEAGADINAMDIYALTPMLYACSSRCLKTVHQLLVVGSALRSHLDQGHSRSVRLVIEFALTEAAYRIDIIEALIEALSSRRRQLLELATSILPAERILELSIVKDQTLDERTSDVYDAVVGINPAVPIAFYSHSRELGTVFHMKLLNSEVADRLFNAGFQDIEGYNAQGLTPLMALGFIVFWHNESQSPLLSWFVCKGANVLTAQRDQDWRTLHFVAAQFGCFSARQWLSYPKGLSSKYMNRCIGEISYAIKYSGGLPLVLRTHDGCFCACSSSGCTMTISMLKAYVSFARDQKMGNVFKGTPRFRFQIVDLWMSLIPKELTLTAEVVDEILRLVLFEELNLTHTCCRFNSRMFQAFQDSTDAYDGPLIQEEEADMIRELEDLLKLAQSCWRDSSEPLSEFIKLFVAENIDGNLKFWDEEYAREVEDLGVKLERSLVV